MINLGGQAFGFILDTAIGLDHFGSSTVVMFDKIPANHRFRVANQRVVLFQIRKRSNHDVVPSPSFPA
jgi:hypothetical protein